MPPYSKATKHTNMLISFSFISQKKKKKKGMPVCSNATGI